MKNIKQYYKHLGRLVYYIAAADGHVQSEERSKLKEFVMKELASHENSSDSSGMNQAFYVNFEFDESISHHTNLNEGLAAFNKFIADNSEPGDEALLARSLSTMETVANAYTKKKEFDIIDVIKDKIKEVNFAIKKS
ncbi:MAG: hypothetical protein IT236_15050 [Bacteroidia bacterium]|nr:hypothetical protein [Bacteroidia bacterium]